ncbi:MAG: 1,4-alpha-glucan branching protein GlgB [Bacteroidota bacterium]
MNNTSPTADQTRVLAHTMFTEEDISRFRKGTHYRLYEKMGAHFITVDGQPGIHYAVWAPNAVSVSVIGDFNGWNKTSHSLLAGEDNSGIWEGFIQEIQPGGLYKYHIAGNTGIAFDKGDPFANYWEVRPKTASIASELNYPWQDGQWMKERKTHNALNAPWSVYEVHLLSWMRPDKSDDQSVNTYLQAIDLLVPYVKQMGFTHVEFMPVMEHPFDGSWGYQGAGYFAPTSRFGPPEDFMQLVDAFHRVGIGVVLDWVPSHFPYDAHGLYMFDGTHTYENADMKRGYHPDWNSYIFDYGKGEVKSFLISSAHFWMDKFHADGIRVDGVSSILILNYSRGEGQWEPNEKGGTANLEAIAFLQDLNDSIYRDFPDTQMIAEESTDWKGVTGATANGGLGFGMKWMMGWMHDTLEYFKLDPTERLKHQNNFTLSMEYYYQENFMLALSHDEVVYGKQPMVLKMPGNEQEKFANLRLLYTYMFTHPGGKLLFMGDEFGSPTEWNYKSELPWGVLQEDKHRQLQDCIRDLNLLLHNEQALYELQFDKAGFEWIDISHPEKGIIVYQRKGRLASNHLLIVLNISNEAQTGWKIPAGSQQQWRVIFRSDDKKYGGNPERVKDVVTGSADVPAVTALVLKLVV